MTATLPTLPPGTTPPPVVPTLPPMAIALPTLPPVVSTLPPASSSLVPTIANGTSSFVPTIANISSSFVPTVTNVTTSQVPTVSNGTSSLVPTVASNETGPPGSLYFEGFEGGEFPIAPWFTDGDAPWTIDTERVRSGTYSIKSGTLDLADITPQNSNLTFITNSDWPDGSLVLSVLPGIELPIDECSYYVDGEFQGKLPENPVWQQLRIPVPPGQHIVLFSYMSNPLGLQELPPVSPDHIGAVYIDDVFFIPLGVTVSPTTASSGGTSLPPVSSSPPPVVGNAPTIPPRTTSTPTLANNGPRRSNEPTYYPSYVPSKSPSSLIASPTPTVASSTPTLPRNVLLFDGFESGDFAALNWTVSGEQAWNVDESLPYEGLFSANVKTADIPNSGDFSQLDLAVSLEEAGFIQFYFNAPVAMPFESFELWVDGSFLTPLATPDANWTQAGAIISSGDHVVSWRYANNPAGAPDDVISSVPPPPYRVGEAWLDNVALLPSTQSFVEDWETQDFTTNNWILSGDADWTITDTNKQDGSYSATVSSSDIPASSGDARLSIDIITEQGGTMTYWILPSVAGPFDIVNVLVDDVIVYSYSNVETNWVTADIQIQPGKREVTFELVKNPGAIPDEDISTIPKPDGHLGQVWLDTITFNTN
eukprot:CCRYP_015237-RA/>CCRYP_015237-RA protein AED:0.25 eAED:0.25 QI:697/1/1/1/0.5/0.33/3/128/649